MMRQRSAPSNSTNFALDVATKQECLCFVTNSLQCLHLIIEILYSCGAEPLKSAYPCSVQFHQIRRYNLAVSNAMQVVVFTMHTYEVTFDQLNVAQS